MFNIWKTDNRTAKRMNIWDSLSEELQMGGTLHVNFQKSYSSHTFHQISSKLYGVYGNPR